YITPLFTWSFVNCTTSSRKKLDISFWANRTGTIATSQFPLVTALGTKNSIITRTSGLALSLNCLHRMSSRVAFVILWVHAGARV
ncbi:hypothetical protein JAAARDRAFT_139655, partial [Jaapia argillacea MUCL 33604]